MAKLNTTQPQTSKNPAFIRCGDNLLKLHSLTRGLVMPSQTDDDIYNLIFWQRTNPQSKAAVLNFDTEEEALAEMTKMRKQLPNQTQNGLLVLANGFVEIEWVDRVVSSYKNETLLIGLFNESPQVQPHWIAFGTEEERSACLEKISARLS